MPHAPCYHRRPQAYVLGELLLSSTAVRTCNIDGHELLPIPELRGDSSAAADTVDLSGAGLATASALVLSTLLSANRCACQRHVRV